MVNQYFDDIATDVIDHNPCNDCDCGQSFRYVIANDPELELYRLDLRIMRNAMMEARTHEERNYWHQRYIQARASGEK